MMQLCIGLFLGERGGEKKTRLPTYLLVLTYGDRLDSLRKKDAKDTMMRNESFLPKIYNGKYSGAGGRQYKIKINEI